MAKIGFKRIESKTKYSQIIEQILEMIRIKVYKPGDRLPNERLLAKEMGVSRGALRESLKALIILGIIDSRQGDGTYISSEQIGLEHALIVLKNPTVERIIRLREVIELGCVAEGIESLTPNDIRQMERRFREMERARKEENHQEYLQASWHFHSDLAKVLLKKQNEPLQNILDYLWRATNLALSIKIYNDYMDDRINQYLSSHREIIEGLKSKSFRVAKKAIKAHYRSILDQLE